MTAKIQQYVDKSLELKREHGGRLGGLPPTELDARFHTNSNRTAAIDQQRQLYAAAHVALLDPRYGDKVIDELITWHDAFVKNFVDQTDEGPVVFGIVEFRPDGSIAKQVHDLRANMRFTYSIEGSATLARALVQAAERNPAKRIEYLRKAREIRGLALSIGETFQKQFADPRVPGRYFLLERGQVPEGNPAEIEGLSHNNSQSYLIKGMESLVALDESGTWSDRLGRLLNYIQAQRDAGSGLLHEFDFKRGGWHPDVVKRTKELGVNFQADDKTGHEIVILGHTVAGVWEAPANLAARARTTQNLEALVQDFVTTMNRLGGIHENGLPGNGYMLVPEGNPPFEPLPWPEAGWQAELVWQFLLRAVEAGIDLKRYEVKTADGIEITLDHLLARGLEVHDKIMFNGLSYVKEKGQTVEQHGRQFADPINHAAESVEALGLRHRRRSHAKRPPSVMPLSQGFAGLGSADQTVHRAGSSHVCGFR